MTVQATKEFETAATETADQLSGLPEIKSTVFMRCLGVCHGGQAQIVLLGTNYAAQACAFHKMIQNLSPTHKKHYLKDYSFEFFQQNTTIGIIFNGRLAGQAVICMDKNNTAMLQALSVHPALRGGDTCKILIEKAVTYAEGQDAIQILARVKQDNKKGQAVFIEGGFSIVDVDINTEDPKQSAYVYGMPFERGRLLARSAAAGQRVRGTALWRQPS